MNLSINLAILKPVATMLIGSSAAMVLSALSVLVATHFFSPAVYGTFQATDSFALIFAFGGTFALDKAFYVSRSKSEDRIIAAMAVSAIFFTTLVAIVLYVFMVSYGLIEAIVSLPIAILYLAIVIMSRGLFFLSRSYQIRELNYKIVAMSDIVQSAILFIGRSLSSLYWPTLLGLLISGIAGTLGGTFKISQTVRRLAIQGLSEISRPRFSYVAWKNRRYFLVESWGGFLRSMAQKGTVVLVTATFGPSKAALTSVALLLLLQPMQVVINPAVDVARSKLATLIRNSDKSNDLIIANLTPLAVILIAPFILAFGIMVLLFLAPTLIGEKWQEVNSVIIYMAPVVYALLVARALQSVFSQLSLQGLALSVDLLSTLVLFVTIYLSWSLGFDLTTSFLAAGVALVLTMYFLFAILLLWTGKYNRVRHSV